VRYLIMAISLLTSCIFTYLLMNEIMKIQRLEKEVAMLVIETEKLLEESRKKHD